MSEHIGKGSDEKCPVVRITDPKEVRKLVNVRPRFRDIEEWLIQMIAESGAILKGHFKLNDDGEQ